jgi:hypothetical protein
MIITWCSRLDSRSWGSFSVSISSSSASFSAATRHVLSAAATLRCADQFCGALAL